MGKIQTRCLDMAVELSKSYENLDFWTARSIVYAIREAKVHSPNISEDELLDAVKTAWINREDLI